MDDDSPTSTGLLHRLNEIMNVALSPRPPISGHHQQRNNYSLSALCPHGEVQGMRHETGLPCLFGVQTTAATTKPLCHDVIN